MSKVWTRISFRKFDGGERMNKKSRIFKVFKGIFMWVKRIFFWGIIFPFYYLISIFFMSLKLSPAVISWIGIKIGCSLRLIKKEKRKQYEEEWKELMDHLERLK